MSKLQGSLREPTAAHISEGARARPERCLDRPAASA